MSKELVAVVNIIAAACHEANAAYCLGLGDTSQVPWASAPEWQRQSAIEGVVKRLEGATPEQLHESWCDSKTRDGWVFGATKDPEKKTHPCLVPYAELPSEQRAKDDVFARVATTMAGLLTAIELEHSGAA